MTRPNPLVLDGSEVKLRLEAERTAHSTPVHVDWVRFTCLLRNVIPDFLPKEIDDFPHVGSATFHDMPEVIIRERIAHELHQFAKEHQTSSFLYPCQQSKDLAYQCAKALGGGIIVNPEIRKGQDFYKYRISLERNGFECGWIGFGASGDSPRQKAQEATIHANIYGTACTFADHGWNDRLANVIDEHQAKLTRADLALDFFDGLGYDMEQVLSDYRAGLMNANGKTLRCNMVGDWANGSERSFYIGSKEAGKQTNIYEKGDQLFGPLANSPWVRIELRYGNKLRVLSSDLLRRPADFFAGASDWHALQVAVANHTCCAEKVATTQRRQVETVEAEVSRNIRWAMNTAAPTIAAAFHYMGDQFLELVTNQKLPGRLQKFNPSELGKAFASAFSTAERFGAPFKQPSLAL